MHSLSGLLGFLTCLRQLEELQPGCVPLLQTPQDLGTHAHRLQEVDSLWPQRRDRDSDAKCLQSWTRGAGDDRITETPMGALPKPSADAP